MPTARRLADEEQIKLASLVENSADFIGMASPDGQVIFVNSAGRRLVGLGREEDVTRTTIMDYLAYPELGRFGIDILPRLWRGGRWEGEVLFRNFQTEEPVPMWQHIFFVTDDHDRRIALATVSRDLSERKRAERKIAEGEAQLARLARVNTLGELTATIAHEVDQPLTAVAANAAACLRWLAADPLNVFEARVAAERIVAEARRASEILVRIRTLMERSPARAEAVDLNKVVGQVLDLVQPRLECQGICQRTVLAADLPAITGDSIQLQQVLLNLIVNAMEADMEAIAQEPAREREIIISSRLLPPASAMISVCDSGVGLDPARLEELFVPFQTTKQHGLGMGLSISRAIVEAHGGRLWASPNQGPGATFQFSIPARVTA